MDRTSGLILAGILAVIGGATIVGLDSKTVTTKEDAIVTQIENVKAVEGKYKHFKEGELAPNTRVDEYVSPEGAGYQVIETSPDGKQIRSYGVGPEAIKRSFDWRDIEPTKVATST